MQGSWIENLIHLTAKLLLHINLKNFLGTKPWPLIFLSQHDGKKWKGLSMGKERRVWQKDVLIFWCCGLIQNND